MSGGPAWYNAGQTQTFDLQPGFKNTYKPAVSTNILASGEIFFGLQQKVQSNLLLQWGVAGSLSSTAMLQGDIWELGEPIFDNYSYQYRIQHRHIAGKGVFLTNLFDSSDFIYFSTSLGYGMNESSQFSLTPYIFEVIAEPPFQANRQYSFTYTLGVGLLKSFSTHWQLGIGYELSDWGHSALGSSLAQTVNGGLKLSHLYTNQLYCQINYLL